MDSPVSSMIERIGRILRKQKIERTAELVLLTDTLPLSQEDIIASKEILAAMRDPTEAMCEAGFEYTGDPCWQDDVGRAWNAMIDEALRE